ncbi:RHE_PE00001 family protein, partial [Nitratireductor sp. GCM10026969]|uniref:RHE_PE00001 family protein n=1 Tax=Nitratireductor sp. GCM10026969 TaxID=3252645 RepID=UPI00360EB7D0
MRRESLDQFLMHVLQPLARAEDLLARLDTRVAHSPCGDGFRARQHFADAAAALWLDGELVHVEELVLHDGRMDARAPTHEVTRAHDVLRTRRRIADRAPGWALSPGGLAALRRREGEGGAAPAVPKAEFAEGDADTLGAEVAENDALAEELAEIDAVLARAGQTLAGAGQEPTGRDEGFAPAVAPWPLPAAEPDPGQAEVSPAAFALLRDPDHDEEALVEQWRARLVALKGEELPPVVTAFLAWDAWETLRPLDRQQWLGPLLVAALLRRCGKARAHLPALSVGLREVPRAER